MVTYLLLYGTILLNLFSETGQTYYISSTGNDNNSGTSSQSAWRSLEKINKLTLRKGDKVLLEGGKIYAGNIRLDEKDGGDSIGKVIISSYGKGKPIIDAGKGTGIFVYNTAGISISNIIVKGSGVSDNNGCGIHCYADAISEKLSGITINNCETTGFRGYGILIQSDKDTTCGFRNVRIINCIATENGEAGIGSLAAYPAVSHQNFYISNCKAFTNRGILTKTDNHSGNGIVLSGVKFFLIDSCEAYENGADCRSVSGGPVGIWVWHCHSGIIQNSHAQHNHAGTCLHDGGGFDIDGGSSGCIIRNCISNDNEGAGYLVCEFGSPLPFTNNIVENNSSRNDGLKNGYGAITLSGAGKEYPVTNTTIRNNKIVVENRNVVDGIPSAIFFNNSDCRNIYFENNSFEIGAGALVLRTDSLCDQQQVVFKKNQFVTKENRFTVICTKCGTTNENFWKERLSKK